MSNQLIADTRENPMSHGDSSGMFDSVVGTLIENGPVVDAAKEAIYCAAGVWPTKIVFVDPDDLASGIVRPALRCTFRMAVLGLYGFRLMSEVRTEKWDELVAAWEYRADLPLSEYIDDAFATRMAALSAVRFYHRGFIVSKNMNAVERLRRVMRFLLVGTPIGELEHEKGTWLVAKN